MLISQEVLSLFCVVRATPLRYANIRVDSDEAPSSSGPGYLVLIQKIAGSNPASGTIHGGLELNSNRKPKLARHKTVGKGVVILRVGPRPTL